MTQELYQDKFGIITFDGAGDVLELRWSEGTAGMSDQDFKDWLERFATFGEKHRTQFMLIDVREFKHKMGKDIGPWRDEKIIPVYNSSGVKKFAFLLPEGARPGAEPASEGPASFPTGYFDKRERIDEWFVAK